MSDGNRTDHIAAETNINVGSMVFVDAKEVLSSTIEGLQAIILKHKALTEPQNPQANCVAALQARVAELEAENAALRNNKTEEEALREMMRDPRYWRHRDPEWVNKVRDGFRKLIGGKDE